ncbi:regulator of nucleoside diphosphate kinase [Mesorhizobium albiziae]|uniref:Regulator of nucleoside diphosphate kinase n=1 Tax=Neomesorhizobium albiziae TaxID=335020 RepID=A0A1I3XLD6_9HYPH|nr:nucleoside-diphosphate kinase [Mesorhizobium albiziae]GLS30349.1 nucleoside-diphosphate kinase [Mesorhizobium albiziae]SFK20300.1 regulator of nucleoside diphosphate kinase [Mesorhizobium albiziae]
MLASAACQLTTKDYTILEAILTRQDSRDDPVLPILKRKLSSARVVFRETVHPDVVTLNSRVAFRVDDSPSITRIVVQGEPRGMVGMTLPITVPRGLTLLGMAKGDTALVMRPDGSHETILVEDVLFQPEAAKWPHARSARAAHTGAPFLRLVHSTDTPVPSATIATGIPAGDDDPGPTAA